MNAEAPDFGPELARSWLLVNAFLPERFDKGRDSAADIILLDLEDAVAPHNKPVARENAAAWLDKDGNEAWLRVNDVNGDHWADDMAMLKGRSGVQGVMVAMVTSPDAVLQTAEALPGVKVVALVETARGVQNLAAIADSGKTFRVAFGVGDFRRDTGFSDDPMALAYTRSQFTIASRAAGLPGSIDGPSVGALGAQLADATGVTNKFGMTGKICLMTEQCSIVNEILAPSLGDISWAVDFLAEFAEQGGEIRNGSDLPRLARAEKILTLAQAFRMPMPEGFQGFPAPPETYHH